MNAHTSDFDLSSSDLAGVSASDYGPARDLAVQWAAVHGAAAAVAALAGLEPVAMSWRERAFPAFILTVSGWRLDLVCNGLNDIAAILRSGLTALLAVSARGQEPAAAARRLWHEFLHARDALLNLTPEAWSLDLNAAECPKDA